MKCGAVLECEIEGGGAGGSMDEESTPHTYMYEYININV